MQALVSLPKIDGGDDPRHLGKVFFRKVGGVPLLARVIATAWRSGATSVLLLHPASLPESWLRSRLQSAFLSSVRIRTVALETPFDADDPTHWQRIEDQLEGTFLWLPYNYVTVKKVLRTLITAGQGHETGVRFPAATMGSDGEPADRAGATGAGSLPALIHKGELLAAGSLQEVLRTL
ncbi:MAG: hypothetical protein ACE5HV_06080, partial [Acidobacteriota bacterium]